MSRKKKSRKRVIHLFYVFRERSESWNVSIPAHFAETPCRLGKLRTAREPPARGLRTRPEGSADGRNGRPSPVPLRAWASHGPPQRHTPPGGGTGAKTKRAFEGQPETRSHHQPGAANARRRDWRRPRGGTGGCGLRGGRGPASAPAARTRPVCRSLFAVSAGRSPPARGGAALESGETGGGGGKGREGPNPHPGRYLRPARTAPPCAARLSLWLVEAGKGGARAGPIHRRRRRGGGGCLGGMVQPSRLPSPVREPEPFGQAVTRARARPGRTPRAARRIAWRRRRRRGGGAVGGPRAEVSLGHRKLVGHRPPAVPMALPSWRAPAAASAPAFERGGRQRRGARRGEGAGPGGAENAPSFPWWGEAAPGRPAVSMATGGRRRRPAPRRHVAVRRSGSVAAAIRSRGPRARSRGGGRAGPGPPRGSRRAGGREGWAASPAGGSVRAVGAGKRAGREAAVRDRGGGCCGAALGPPLLPALKVNGDRCVSVCVCGRCEPRALLPGRAGRLPRSPARQERCPASCRVTAPGRREGAPPRRTGFPWSSSKKRKRKERWILPSPRKMSKRAPSSEALRCT